MNAANKMQQGDYMGGLNDLQQNFGGGAQGFTGGFGQGLTGGFGGGGQPQGGGGAGFSVGGFTF